MVKSQKLAINLDLTIEDVYFRLSLLIISLFLGIIAIFLRMRFQDVTYSSYMGLLAFFLFIFLTGEAISFCIIKLNKEWQNNTNLRLWIYIILGVLTLIVIIKYSIENLITGLISIFGSSVLIFFLKRFFQELNNKAKETK